MTEDFTEKFKESFNNVENWVRETDKYWPQMVRSAVGTSAQRGLCPPVKQRSSRILRTSGSCLKAVEETSEDCLRRVANCATFVCPSFGLRRIATNGVEKVPNSALQPRNFAAMCGCSRWKVPISVFEGKVDSMSVDASKNLSDISIKRCFA